MTLIPEHLIDRRINQTVQYIDNSDLGVKLACVAASNVVGTYDGTTQEIARQTRRSVSTVQNWAHAHWMYKAARQANNGGHSVSITYAVHTGNRAPQFRYQPKDTVKSYEYLSQMEGSTERSEAYRKLSQTQARSVTPMILPNKSKRVICRCRKK